MNDVLIMVLSGLGALFVLLAAVGLVRMPDLYLRISVTTKAATLGIGLLLACAGIYFQEGAITARIIAIVFFVFLTAPVGAHLIGRASYFVGVKLWGKTKVDRLEGKYHKKNHRLES
jgi:multicomponent Na+:H+ antiporter subunit G